MVSLRCVTGAGITELNDLLDSLSNNRRHNTMRIAGTGLTLLGLAVLAFAFRRRSKVDSQSI